MQARAFILISLLRARHGFAHNDGHRCLSLLFLFQLQRDLRGQFHLFKIQAF